MDDHRLTADARQTVARAQERLAATDRGWKATALGAAIVAGLALLP